MNDFIIMTDSCCDLPAQLADKLELTVLPLSFTINGKEHYNYLDGRDISSSHFYRLLREGTQCTTSAANTNAFLSAMEPVLKKGKDILCICFSSALSTTCASAQMAAKELVLKYPNNKIYIVDSLSASLGQGMLTYYAVQQKQNGKTIEQVYQWMEQNKLHLCHWFTVDDLNHLKRGGRISPAVAFVGSLLGMKPILHVDDTGHLVNVGKIKGRRASLSQLGLFGRCRIAGKYDSETTPCKRHYHKPNWSRYWLSLRSRYTCCIFLWNKTINKNSHTIIVWLFLCSWNVRSAFLS